ncbi:MAG: DMT family transporter [Bacteroidetes bacterium]|nr:DMT family transporter [Bacteroidota bacterium]
MNQLFLSVIAFTGGVFLAAQGVFNSQLGVLLKSPLLAAVTAFFSSTFFAFLFVVISAKNPPSLETIKSVPLYLWFTGGLLSVIGISLYYYTIPKLGISTMISLGLFGQIIFSLIAGHFGLMGLPVEPITVKRVLGVISMTAGIFLINFK